MNEGRRTVCVCACVWVLGSTAAGDIRMRRFNFTLRMSDGRFVFDVEYESVRDSDDEKRFLVTSPPVGSYHDACDRCMLCGVGELTA